MEAASRPPERDNFSTINSPNSNGTSTATTNGSTPPLTPTPIAKPSISRSHESNPCPTTFVQADTATFKHVVQMLTGAGKPDPPARGGIPPIKSTGQKKQGFKLYERRNIMINTFLPGISQNNSGFSPRKAEILSPSILDFPSLLLSPATPMNEESLSKASSEEEKAIAEKKFYLHPPSPRTAAAPQLLPLFPVTSPRVPGSS